MSADIEARGLAQRYRRQWVFRGLDLSVGGGVTALLGPNGAGKTTLLHTIVGIRPAVAGQLEILGEDALRRHGNRAVAARLGFLPQSIGYYPRYTLREFVAYAAWLKGVPDRLVWSRADAALTRVGLRDRAGSKMRTLSGGMVRRAGLAQAVVHDPRLVLLDEPAAGLDPRQRIDLRRLLRDLGRRASVLVSTHVVEDVRHTADRVLVLRGGELVFAGSVAELAARATGDAAGDSDLERGYLAVLEANDAEVPR